MNPFLSAALGYAGRGWPVLPLHSVKADGGCSCGDSGCGSIGKHPRTLHGLKDASTDPKVIRGWWKTWSSANVGIVTGPASGVWILGPDGAEGSADLGQLVREFGELPKTACVRSGSGGEHLYFVWPSDGKPIPNRRNHRGLKIDVRACGTGPGYAVAPPSVNENGRYEWLEECAVAEAPAWLVEWARGTTAKVAPSKPRPDAIERAKRYLAKCPPAVSGQGGHSQTFAVARALCWGFQLPPEVAFELLKAEYNPRCLPPWSDAELQHKIDDAHSKDFGKPRGYLNGESNSGDFGDASLRNSASNKSNSGDFGDASLRHDGWKPPSALPEMPVVPPFPIDLLPDKVGQYLAEAARSLAVPVDYVAVPGLALLGAAIGRTHAVGVKGGYYEVPSLWVAVIAPPGATKSASLKLARAPLAWAEAKWMAKHQAEVLSFDTADARYAECLKDWKKGGCEGEPPEKPRRPTLRQVTLDSTTVEAAAKVLGDNERGAILVKDELSAFVKSMNQYRSGGKGDDKQFWLSVWAGASTKVNRAGTHAAGPLLVPHPFLAIAGMMTPSSLPELRGDNRHGESTEDGFCDRFLFSFPDPVDAIGETWAEVSEVLKAGYAEVFNDLLGFEMVSESDPTNPLAVRHRPYVVPLGDDAREVWELFTQSIAERMNRLDKFDPFRGVLSKLRGYGARLAIALWSVRRVCGEVAPNAPMDAETLRRATELVDYFESHARRCLGIGWADRKHRVAKRLLNWLAKSPEKKAFGRTEAFQQLKDRRDVTSTDGLSEVFRFLTDYGYIRPVDPTGTGRPGPVPEVYSVNPLWGREL